jgi:hypothetical protein
MEPTRHHLDPSQSEVISHIRRTLDYDQDAAVRAFNSMRNVKSQVLVFDRVHRVWYGCDWTPDDEEAKKDFFTQRFADMKREVSNLREEVRDLDAMQKKLIKGMDMLWDFIESGTGSKDGGQQQEESKHPQKPEISQMNNHLAPDAGQQMKNAVEMAWR